jgi:predicted O-methyltransferase YrrM
MSATSTALSDEHFAYIAARTVRDDAFMVRLKEAAAAAGIPAIWICPEQASFMRILLSVAKAREVVEVGTLAGYSAITMARALPSSGRVRTIELDENHARFAEQWIAESDAAGKVEVHRGRGADVLPSFADHSADAMFIDADKPGYATYVEQALRIVRPGGMVLIDNALAFGELLNPESTDPSVQAIRDINEIIAAERRLHGVIVPIGDGLWVCVKKD